MSDRDLPRGNGWTHAESWVRADIARLEEKVDRLSDEVAESRGRVKTWQVFVIALSTAAGGGAVGVSLPSAERDQAKQIENLQDAVLNMREDVDRILRAGDNR